MLFNSLQFLVFFPVVFLLYWALPHRGRKYFLLAVSYYFYMCWKPEFIVLILYSTAVDYFCALGMERRAEQKKLFLAVSLTMNLGLLFFFKYFNFFGATLTALCRAVSIPFSAPVLDIILPVGISLYTFQTLSYTIDVYRGKMKPEHDFLYFALFVSYFPQLVAGPIERAEELLPRLKAEHRFDYGRAAHGARLMAWGFFKKCVCAAYLGTLADKVYGNAEAYGGVCRTDLLRFRRVFRHCPRLLGAAGRGADGELQTAVFRPLDAGFLAQMAYLPDRLVSGVCLYSLGRKPKGARQNGAFDACDLPAQRAVARGGLDLCGVGRHQRLLSGAREPAAA